MCSEKWVTMATVTAMATATLIWLVFATVGPTCGSSCRVANGLTTTTAVLENCNAQQTESDSTDVPIHSIPVGLRTSDLIAVSSELKLMLTNWISSLSEISIFPILTVEAQPQRDSHPFRRRWHPYSGENLVQNGRHFPRPGPRGQPGRDQLVPEMDDTVEFLPRSQSNEHLVPVVVDVRVLRHQEQRRQEVFDQVVPGCEQGDSDNNPDLPAEEPSFQDLESNHVVPDDHPDDVMAVTDGQDVVDPFLGNLELVLSLAAASTMPWADALRYIFLCGNEIAEEKLEQFRAQIRVLESMTNVFLFNSRNDKNRRV